MANNATILGMVIALLISFGVPIGLLIYFREKYRISYKVLIGGALTFIIFSQVLEKLLEVTVKNTTQILGIL